MSQIEFTHNGWMMFCPVKLAALDTEEPLVAARWLVLEPLLWVANVVQSGVIWLCSATMPDYEPHWYFKITGERLGVRRYE